ncbi:sulfite exporter TauE/SafE family protein [Halioxenophilus aromaticivorans]|uniref:Probable membrane transporter protein n=1 Tax=Halioxenophilus aromaticivorans TaxID=1306992 RepID=A0AAV3U403_9ALTE
MSTELLLVFPVLGVVVGIAAGLLGVGGGGIMVPALSAIFAAMGFSLAEIVHLALGTSMATIITTSISSARTHHQKGSVNWVTWRAMTPGVLIGTFLATFLVALLPAQLLATFFACFMGFVAVQMWRPLKATSQSNPAKAELFAAGAGIGGVSALVSIGGGSLTVPYLNWRKHPMTNAVGTSAALGLPIALTGTLGYLINGWQHTDLSQGVLGYIYLPAVLVLSIFSAIAAPFGVRLAHSLPVPTLRKVFAVLLVVISLRMFWQVVGG